ncbi:MAG TPA: hypothetical protein VLX92_34225 [Kofleriaceae bacterium]|nr:hypothetical protein [Kofleriaceae bacterium]
MGDSKPHPLIAKVGASGAVRLLGYFGETHDGVVELYPSLEDLSVHLEIPEAAILHVEDAPASELPHDGSAVWVAPDTKIVTCTERRVTLEARFLSGAIASKMTAAAPQLTSGYEPQPNTYSGPTCQYSVWPCSVVEGACLPTNFPCVYTQNTSCQYYSQSTCIVTCGNQYTCGLSCVTAHCPRTVGCTTELCPRTIGCNVTRGCPVGNY